MPYTNFQDNVTTLLAAWLNKMNIHDHKNLEIDGSCPHIEIDDLDPTLQALLNDLAGVRSLIPQLFAQGRSRLQAFGGTGKDGNFTGGYNLENPVYEFNNFTINAGTTVRVTRGFTRIKCTGDVLINGALIGDPINPFGVGKAWFTTGGQAYNTGVDFVGSAGGETVDHSNLSGLQVIRDRGGFGGAGIIFDVLGSIIINGTVACNGGNAGVATILSGNPILGGSGGGSGGSGVFQSYTRIQVNGTIDLLGGRGADGFGINAAGGGGGAGGRGIFIAPEINRLVNSVNVSGGSPGTSLGTGNNAGAGGGGFGGVGGNTKGAGNAGTILDIVGTNFSYL